MILSCLNFAINFKLKPDEVCLMKTVPDTTFQQLLQLTNIQIIFYGNKFLSTVCPSYKISNFFSQNHEVLAVRLLEAWRQTSLLVPSNLLEVINCKAGDKMRNNHKSDLIIYIV